ncbi:urease accessory protein UreF [Ureaplasma sp. ES3154-GEN]|uniref:urease accessory protein UreF n=1 Tax=Ureaplasma sp. ES3154-GEN TaxID=2984844 RepID=UPI0021E7F050|nr:urease accessory protein UreF [Ureaplasma sp. ES3154-GEN]
MQITNANFPIGTFSHSFGIETYIRKEIVDNSETLEKALLLYMNEQLLYGDLLAIRRVYELLESDEINEIWEVDNMISFQGLARETRDGQRRIGVQMIKIYNELYKGPLLIEYYRKIKAKECYGNPAISFALLANYLNIDLHTALYTHLYSTTAALTQNCVRAIPLGQVPGQILVNKLKHTYFDDIITKALNLDFESDFCKNIPGLEIAQMEHEDVPVRLFMS